MRKPLRSGWTLMELMIAVVIVGLLAAILTVNLRGSQDKAEDRQAATYLQMYRRACQAYYEDFGMFPNAMAQLPDVQIPTSTPWAFAMAAAGGATWPLPAATSTVDGREWRIQQDGTIN